MNSLFLLALAFVPAAPAPVVLTGDFREGGVPNETIWENRAESGRAQFGTGAEESGTGSFRTRPFRVSGEIRCFVAGFPRSPGIRMYLRDAANGRELPLVSTADPSLAWRERIWNPPGEWQGRTVEFAVEDRSRDPQRGWIAVTVPEIGQHAWWLSYARAAYRSLFLVFEFVWLLIPGMAIALISGSRALWQIAATSIVGAALAGYGVFWVYVLNPQAGVIASGMVLAAGLAVIWANRTSIAFGSELRLMLCAVLLTAIFYNALGFLYYTDDGPDQVAQRRFNTGSMPPDNMLQYLFAKKIYRGESVRPYLIATTHASDRPPLETALVLEQWQFWRLLNDTNSYLLLGIGLQCLWLAAVWLLLRRCSVQGGPVMAVLALTIFTAFAWENSFYVWPKLMAAAFCLLGMAAIPIIRGSREPWSLRQTVFCALCFSLSLLSHSGSGFTMLAVVLLTAMRRRLPPWRYSAIALLAALALIAPWRAYQVWIDPPGDTLFKLHLAGVSDDKLSLGAALAKGFRSVTPAEYFAGRLRNFCMLVALPWPRPGEPLASNIADEMFFCFFPCAGLLNLGLLARLRLRRAKNAVRVADRLLLISLLSLGVWCVLMFQPGSAYVHQGSYATVLLYFVAMALYLSSLSARVTWALAAVQALVVFPCFVFLEPVLSASADSVSNASIDPGFATVAAGSALLMVWMGVRFCRTQAQLR